MKKIFLPDPLPREEQNRIAKILEELELEAYGGNICSIMISVNLGSHSQNLLMGNEINIATSFSKLQGDAMDIILALSKVIKAMNE